MKPYPAYRPTGLPWLPQIPAHWEQRRAKNIFTESSKIVGRDAKNYPLLSLTLRGVIHRDIDSGKGKFPASFDTYKVVEKGNMVFCLFDVEETPRTVGLSEYEGMITGAYTIFQVHGVNARFIYYYYLALDNVKALQPLYSGLRKTIPIERLLGMRLPVPPREEQDRIVRFLDAKVAQIDRLIAIKQRQIEDLVNLKKKIIHQAVCGETSKVGLRATGIPWNPQCPQHWNIQRAKYLFFTEKTLNVGNKEKNVLSLTLNGVIRNNSDSPIGLSPQSYATYQLFNPNDLVFKLIDLNNVSTSRVGLVPERGVMSSAYLRLIARKKCNVRYFFYQYYDLWLRNVYNGLGAGVRQTLDATDLLNMMVLLPPPQEQDEIVYNLDNAVIKIAETSSVLMKQIDCLKELKARLISDVVTGAVDVRGKEA
ncbi:MAG TPA: restriction endonuclease subunit S [Candidatus Spyradenecus faecavium]|uniref:Restriction endonuclease subunit S n=1 Tax=Candidatus Spyradenecus faecavium TaxID=2840947 RepID=A0A9D1NNM9_9BACT|nr:restriction endonuclease subunit S [Candidatus Spyradenecus faecavium]